MKRPTYGAEMPSMKQIVERAVGDIEREALLEALRRAAGNKAGAARLLRIDYKTLYSKLKKYGLHPNSRTLLSDTVEGRSP
jgi:two-component system nitrogen regulation response regulator GlnG